MSAREKIQCIIEQWSGEFGTTPEALEYDGLDLLDAYAHELAEKIRADILPEEQLVYREQQAEADGIRHAADLIDPEVCKHGIEMRCDDCGACHVHESHADGCAIAGADLIDPEVTDSGA